MLPASPVSPLVAPMLIGTPPEYLLYDDFEPPVAAGLVNNTFAHAPQGVLVRVPQKRTVTDTNSKLSITGGAASFATGGVGGGNPGLWYASQARAAGKALLCTLNGNNDNYGIGYDTNQSGSLIDAINFQGGTNLRVFVNGTGIVVGAVVTSTAYQCLVLARASGFFAFIKGGTFSNWTYLLSSALNSGALFPQIAVNSGTTAVFTADNIRIPAQLFSILASGSDSFARANGAIGTTDGLGTPEGGGGSLVWTGAAYTIASNKAVGTPTQGSELITNGNMETGDPPSSWTAAANTTAARETTTIHAGSASLKTTLGGVAGGYVYQSFSTTAGVWYFASTWIYKPAGQNTANHRIFMGQTAGSADYNNLLSTTNDAWVNIVAVVRAATTATVVNHRPGDGGTTINDYGFLDDVSTKALTLSTLIASVVQGHTDSVTRVKVSALTAGTQAGLCARIDNAGTPTQGLFCYFSNGNVVLDEFTGTTSYKNNLSSVKAFTADDSLELNLLGSAWRVYHVTSAGVTVLIGSGTTTITTGLNFGLFSTYASNTFGGFSCYPTANGSWDMFNAV